MKGAPLHGVARMGRPAATVAARHQVCANRVGSGARLGAPPALSSNLVQCSDKVLGSQVGIALEHLHRLVATDGCNLLIGELAAFHEPAHGFVFY